MKTVSEVEKITGVSVRTLRYYDHIGLLKPSRVSGAGYRYYDDDALERLQQILLYRELQFPLKEIKCILDSPAYDRTRALKQQADMLTLKKEHLENLISLTRGLQLLGVKYMDFSAFDTRKIDEYSARARESWGKTQAWQEFEQKSKNRSREDELRLGTEVMQLFAGFGELIPQGPASSAAQAQVEKMRSFFTAHFYNCTLQILSGLGRMYSGGGEMSESIDRAGGPGTAEFVGEAVRIYCERN